MEKLKYILGWILIFLFNVFSWAATNSNPDIEFETVDDDKEDGETINVPGHMEGDIPIDMYEGILIAIAIVLILRYYYYTTQKSRMIKS